MQDEKYLVFKKKEFLEQFPKWTSADLPQPLEDATVIRGQDMLAQPLLSVYVDMIAVILKTGGLSDTERVNLQRTSDYFHDRAAEAHELGFKLPD
jgi:hypothetical protein